MILRDDLEHRNTSGTVVGQQFMTFDLKVLVFSVSVKHV